MRAPHRFASLALLLLAVAPAASAQIEVGSPVIDRNNDDGASGIIYLYLGGTQPVAGPGQVLEWSFFDNEAGSAGRGVTPLIFEQTAAGSWTVVAVGTTRRSTAGGVQAHSFGVIAGTYALAPGRQYTVGFTHRFYTGSGATFAPGAAEYGVVDFVGYGLLTDRWAYAFGTALPGTVLGTGGLPLDSQGLGGRIYSARFRVGSIVSVPGCSTNPSRLSANVPSLSPGLSFNLTVTSSSPSSALWQIYFGFDGTNAAGCGLPLPGIGEFLILPGSQLLLGGGALQSGSAVLPLAVPTGAGLVGSHVMFQALTASIVGSVVSLEMSNGLMAGIVR